MTDTTTRVRELFERIDQTPYGPEERALLSEAISIAEEAGADELAYEARMRLTSSANVTGDTDAMFASFGWCVGMHDSDPVRFPLQSGNNDLLFQYKWMASRLTANPAFSLAQVDAIHDDMAARYAQAGVGPSGVLQSRFYTALLRGELGSAAELYEECHAAPEDEYSHCDACARNEDALFFQLSGQDERAIAVYDEIIGERLTCGVEPETSESEALLPYLRAGRLDEAKAAHLRSYRAARSREDNDNIGLIANHLVFCAVTGNEARGLAMLERHIGALANDPLNQAGHLHALTAIGVLLDAVSRAGHPDTVVRGAAAPELASLFGANAEAWTATDLSSAAWAAAERLAAAFDARNGNTAKVEGIARAKALAGEHYDVPVNTDTFLARPVPAAPDDTPTTPAGWLERGREALSVGAVDAALRAIDSGLALPDDGNALRLYGLAVQLLVARGNDGDSDGASAALAHRVELLRAAGRTDRADSEERLALLVFGAASDDDRPALEEALAAARSEERADEVIIDLLITLAEVELRSDAATAADERLSEAAELSDTAEDSEQTGIVARFMRTHALLQMGVADEAAENLDALISGNAPRFLRVPMLRMRAQLHGASGEVDAGIAVADELVAVVTAIGHRDAIVDASQLSAHLLSDAGRDGEAAIRMQYAIRQSELSGGEAAAGLRFQLGRFQHFAGDADAAVETLDDVYRRERDAGAQAGSLAETLFWLGEAAQAAGDGGLAYGAWTRAIELAGEAEDPALGAQAGISLGQLLVSFNDNDAVEVLEAALATATAGELLQHRVNAQHKLGQARAQFGDPRALDDLDAALEVATAEGADWLVADISDSKARALAALGRPEEAIALALSASDAFAAIGDSGACAMAELFAARVLAQNERAEDAVSIYRSVIERLPEGSPAHTGVVLEFGTVLEQLGRHEEAAAVRALVDGEQEA